MKGLIISIEGTDGSGKHTQQQLLSEDLKDLGYSVYEQSFPNYNSPSSDPVKMYLSGEFGADPNCLDAYQASTLYAVDRLCTYKKDIEQHYNAGEIILFDRYVQSNLIHQTAKIKGQAERQKFMDFICDLEHEKLGLPRPDLVFFIEMPVEQSLKLARARQAYKSEQSTDILEENTSYMENAYDTGMSIAKKFGWQIIKCVDKDGNLKHIEDIHNEIMQKTFKFLESGGYSSSPSF